MTTSSAYPPEDMFKRAAKRALICLPLYVLVPVLFAIGFRLYGFDPHWGAYGLGALGWLAALVLRGPVIAVANSKLPREKAMTVVGASSGVLEESVRIILLALTSFSASWAVSIGQGWAAIEVLFVMVNVIAIASLAGKTDEKSMQAKQMLEAQGTIHGNPLWGVLERVWASAFHIGCTLVVASAPWLVILLVPLHSTVNFITVRLAKKSIGRSSLFIAVCGACLLALGLAMA